MKLHPFSSEFVRSVSTGPETPTTAPRNESEIGFQGALPGTPAAQAEKMTRPPFERIKAIHSLLASGRYPNCAKVAERFEVSPKTIQRDIDFMRDRLNLPIEYSATRRGYHYADKATTPPTVQHSAAEWTSLLAAKKGVQEPPKQPGNSALSQVLGFWCAWQILLCTAGPSHRTTLLVVEDLRHIQPPRPNGMLKFEPSALEALIHALERDAFEEESLAGLRDIVTWITGQGIALRLCAALFSSTERVLGRDSLTTAECAHVLAELTYAEAPAESAGLLFRRAFEGFERHLGPNHEKTLGALFGLTASLMYDGEFTVAQTLFARLFASAVRSEGSRDLRRLSLLLLDFRNHPQVRPLQRMLEEELASKAPTMWPCRGRGPLLSSREPPVSPRQRRTPST